MKQTILTLMCLIITSCVVAQKSKTAVGGYGAGTAELTWLNGKPALVVGAYGGVLLNHRLLLGGAGSNIIFKQQVNSKEENFQFNYYGFHAAYKLMPEKPVHFSAGFTGAIGWLENNVLTEQKKRKKDGAYTYVLQPKLGVDIKITKFMQAQVYGAYRITGDTRSSYYPGNHFSGFSGAAGLMFGSF